MYVCFCLSACLSVLQEMVNKDEYNNQAANLLIRAFWTCSQRRRVGGSESASGSLGDARSWGPTEWVTWDLAEDLTIHGAEISSGRCDDQSPATHWPAFIASAPPAAAAAASLLASLPLKFNSLDAEHHNMNAKTNGPLKSTWEANVKLYRRTSRPDLVFQTMASPASGHWGTCPPPRL